MNVQEEYVLKNLEYAYPYVSFNTSVAVITMITDGDMDALKLLFSTRHRDLFATQNLEAYADIAFRKHHVHVLQYFVDMGLKPTIPQQVMLGYDVDIKTVTYSDVLYGALMRTKQYQKAVDLLSYTQQADGDIHIGVFFNTPKRLNILMKALPSIHPILQARVQVAMHRTPNPNGNAMFIKRRKYTVMDKDVVNMLTTCTNPELLATWMPAIDVYQLTIFEDETVIPMYQYSSNRSHIACYYITNRFAKEIIARYTGRYMNEKYIGHILVWNGATIIKCLDASKIDWEQVWDIYWGYIGISNFDFHPYSERCSLTFMKDKCIDIDAVKRNCIMGKNPSAAEWLVLHGYMTWKGVYDMIIKSTVIPEVDIAQYALYKAYPHIRPYTTIGKEIYAILGDASKTLVLDSNTINKMCNITAQLPFIAKWHRTDVWHHITIYKQLYDAMCKPLLE